MYTVRSYVRPESLNEAITELRSGKHNRVVGGGVFLKMQHRAIGKLISLDGLGLDQITETEDSVHIGGAVSLREIETNPIILEHFPALSYAVSQIVGVQMRNLAQIGASVFSRYGFSDIIPCLVATGAKLRLAHAGEFSVEAFLTMDRDWDILYEIIIPKGVTLSYDNLRQTNGDFSSLNLAIGKSSDQVRIVYGARPMGAFLAEQASAAAGQGKTLEQVTQLVKQEVPFGTNLRASAKYRRHLAGVLLEHLWEAE